MESRMVGLLGTAAKHILHAFRRALRAVAVTGLVVALVVAVATEAIGAFLTHSFPSGPTHLAAAALAIAFGYAAAITVFMEEILRAMIKAIELIIEESERVAAQAVREAEVLARKAEEEAARFGHAAVTDAERFGRASVNDVESFGRGVGSVVSGAVGGVASEARSVEHGVAAHIPGHHGENTAATVPASATISNNG